MASSAESGGKGYVAFVGELHRKALERRIPVSGTLELTARCNLSCRHCYVNRAEQDERARAQELSASEWRRIIDELAEAGCLWLVLTGGEPLVRTDFLEIYQHAVRSGMLVTVFTNATLLDEVLADGFADAPPFAVEVSVYGHTPAIAARVTGDETALERCRRGIELLCSRGIPLRLKTVSSNLNASEVPALEGWARGEVGVPFRFDALLNARLDGGRGPVTLRLSPHDVVAHDFTSRRQASELERVCGDLLSTPAAGSGGHRLYMCGAGRNSFAVTWQGNLVPCIISPNPGWDMRTGSFREAWEGPMARLVETPGDPRSRCASCALRPICGICPAFAELEHGDPSGVVEYLCEVAHLRAEAAGVLVPGHGNCPHCAGGR